jgi:hypothetical protein
MERLLWSVEYVEYFKTPSGEFEPQIQKVVEERDSRVDETDLGGPT